MRHGTFLHVARDAWRLILPILLLAIALAALLSSALWIVLGALLCVPLVLWARDSDRQVNTHPLGLVAPADGQIVHRRECHDPYLDRAAIRLSIEINRWGAYYFRAPTEGTLMEVKSRQPCPRIDQASWLRTDEKDDIVLVVNEGSLLGQRPCDAEFGQRVGQGRRCGGRRFARRITVYVPTNCRVDVELGQKVRAGHDVLATMVHNASKPEPVSA